MWGMTAKVWSTTNSGERYLVYGFYSILLCLCMCAFLVCKCVTSIIHMRICMCSVLGLSPCKRLHELLSTLYKFLKKQNIYCITDTNIYIQGRLYPYINNLYYKYVAIH